MLQLGEHGPGNRDGQSFGVSIGELATGTIQNNQIHGNAHGIMIFGGINPIVRGNTIRDGGVSMRRPLGAIAAAVACRDRRRPVVAAVYMSLDRPLRER